MHCYGNYGELIHGTMDNYKPIEHGASSPTELACVANGRRVKCLKTGLTYPTVTSAAVAAGVAQPTMALWIKAGKGWVKVAW